MRVTTPESLFVIDHKIARIRSAQVTDIRHNPQKLLHSSCTGQKWLIFINYISDLFVTDIMVGDWGSGKTYAWNEALTKVREAGNAARPGYAYVSLFGVNSLAQLNVAIFRHSEGMTDGSKSPLEASGLAKLGRLTAHLKSIPILKDYAEAADQLMAFEIRDRIICLDDLERMSSGMSVTELMGFASFLKERRNCKIVFVAHTDKLDERDEFARLSEKVVDITLRFVRLPTEASAIAITQETPLAELTRQKCSDLGIKNIRVIRQIWRLVGAIDPLVRHYEPPILDQAVHSLSLFGWCRLQPNIAPDEQFIMKRGHYQWMSDAQERELTADEKAWTAVLDRYGFGAVDEFDKVLAQGVVDGFFDQEAVKIVAEQKSALFKSEKAGNSVTDAWSAFHHGFGGTEESVATAIFEGVKQHALFVTPMNLDGSVRMLKQLGFENKALELIGHYVYAHSGNLRVFDLDGYAFSEDVQDADVRNAFEAKANSVPDTRDPLDVFIQVSKQGTSLADRKLLESLTTEQLIAIFRRADSNTRRVVTAALEHVPLKPDDPDPLHLRANAALISIGSESLLNRIRVKRYGITDDDLGPPNASSSQ